jgi:hypothetical protein
MKLMLNEVLAAAGPAAMSTRSFTPTTGHVEGRRAFIAGGLPVSAVRPRHGLRGNASPAPDPAAGMV